MKRFVLAALACLTASHTGAIEIAEADRAKLQEADQARLLETLTTIMGNRDDIEVVGLSIPHREDGGVICGSYRFKNPSSGQPVVYATFVVWHRRQRDGRYGPDLVSEYQIGSEQWGRFTKAVGCPSSQRQG